MILTGRHIAAARGLLGMTQGELAEAAGVERNTIMSWEAGDRVPRAATVENVRAALERRGIEFQNSDSPGVRLRGEKTLIPV